MPSSKTSIVILVFLTLLLLFVISILGVTLMLLFFSITNNISEPTESFQYDYTEINPSRSNIFENSNGFVDLPKKLSEEDYISYTNSEGSLFVVTNSGGTNYECSGQCFCDSQTDPKRRSTVPTLLTRSLYVLISAFSLTMANKIANEAFHNDCVHKYSQIDQVCDEAYIRSTVETCEEEKLDDTSVPPADATTTDEVVKYKFICKGSCVDNPEFDRNKAIDFGMSEIYGPRKTPLEDFDCSHHSVLVYVFVETNGLTFSEKVSNFFKSKVLRKKVLLGEEEARSLMRKDHLEDFCKSVKVEGDPKYDEFHHQVGIDICTSEKVDQAWKTDESKIRCFKVRLE